MNQEELRTLSAIGETLTVEFKSDQGPLSDADLIETIVCIDQIVYRLYGLTEEEIAIVEGRA